MHSSSFVALFAGAAAAQSTVSVINIWAMDKTLTFKGSDATATTYEKVCPPSASGAESSGAVSSQVSSQQEESTATLSTPSALILTPLTGPPTPRPTPQALVRRQAASGDINSFKSGDWCAPYTLIQGSETWAFHLTDTQAPDWTINANCNWKGASTTAELTCTAAFDGDFTVLGEPGTTSETLAPSEVASASMFGAITVVSATGSGAGPASTGGAGASGASNAASSTPASGIAPHMALQTGAVALVGGIFAAALAL